MKKYPRLRAAAQLQNHPAGYLIFKVTEDDGGEFSLVPHMDDYALYLADPDSPSYRVAVVGDKPETLERFGKAILALSRRMAAVEAGEEPADEADASD